MGTSKNHLKQSHVIDWSFSRDGHTSQTTLGAPHAAQDHRYCSRELCCLASPCVFHGENGFSPVNYIEKIWKNRMGMGVPLKKIPSIQWKISEDSATFFGLKNCLEALVMCSENHSKICEKKRTWATSSTKMASKLESRARKSIPDSGIGAGPVTYGFQIKDNQTKHNKSHHLQADSTFLGRSWTWWGILD